MTLQEKAKTALEAMNNNDIRFHLLINMLQVVTGLSENECIEKIKDIAK